MKEKKKKKKKLPDNVKISQILLQKSHQKNKHARSSLCKILRTILKRNKVGTQSNMTECQGNLWQCTGPYTREVTIYVKKRRRKRTRLNEDCVDVRTYGFRQYFWKSKEIIMTASRNISRNTNRKTTKTRLKKTFWIDTLSRKLEWFHIRWYKYGSESVTSKKK